MTDIIPLRQRPKYNIALQLAWALGTIIGPLLGGVIAQNTTWRWIFYINFPFCASALGMIPFVMKRQNEGIALWKKLLNFDWLGGALFITSMTSFLIAITWGGIQYPWGSYRTFVPLIVGVLGLCLTIAWELWGTKQPFLCLNLFVGRSAILAYACTVLQGLLVSLCPRHLFLANFLRYEALRRSVLYPLLPRVCEKLFTYVHWCRTSSHYMHLNTD